MHATEIVVSYLDVCVCSSCDPEKSVLSLFPVQRCRAQKLPETPRGPSADQNPDASLPTLPSCSTWATVNLIPPSPSRFLSVKLRSHWGGILVYLPNLILRELLVHLLGCCRDSCQISHLVSFLLFALLSVFGSSVFWQSLKKNTNNNLVNHSYLFFWPKLQKVNQILN